MGMTETGAAMMETGAGMTGTGAGLMESLTCGGTGATTHVIPAKAGILQSAAAQAQPHTRHSREGGNLPICGSTSAIHAAKVNGTCPQWFRSIRTSFILPCAQSPKRV